MDAVQGGAGVERRDIARPDLTQFPIRGYDRTLAVSYNPAGFESHYSHPWLRTTCNYIILAILKETGKKNPPDLSGTFRLPDMRTTGWTPAGSIQRPNWRTMDFPARSG